MNQQKSTVFGENVQRARIEAGLSVVQLAEKCGIARETLVKVESGQPVRDWIPGKIARGLDCTVAELESGANGDTR
jgi:DNA-binding XRE family transcriptional regulator